MLVTFLPLERENEFFFTSLSTSCKWMLFSRDTPHLARLIVNGQNKFDTMSL